MNLYLEALKLAAESAGTQDVGTKINGCCSFILKTIDENVLGDYALTYSQAFATTFRPEGSGYSAWFFAYENGSGREHLLPPEELRERRLTALALAAAMYETGDLS
jgi:hypothetical protein